MRGRAGISMVERETTSANTIYKHLWATLFRSSFLSINHIQIVNTDGGLSLAKLRGAAAESVNIVSASRANGKASTVSSRRFMQTFSTSVNWVARLPPSMWLSEGCIQGSVACHRHVTAKRIYSYNILYKEF